MLKMRLGSLIPVSAMMLPGLILPACSAAGRGGATEPSFNVEEDLAALETYFGNAVAIETVYKDGATSEKRDKMIAGRLVMMNLRYIQFVRTITSEKQFLDSATDILVLSLNLAGVSFTDETARTILAALSAGLTGSKAVIDKHYYYEKTMPALVAAMNAQRKQALIPILRGVGTSLNEYPVEQAVVDLDSYYHAGTLLGAINAIHIDAAEREQAADEVIALETRARIVSLLPSSSRVKLDAIGDAIEQLDDSKLDAAKNAITALGGTASEIQSTRDARRWLTVYLRRVGREATMVDEMHTAMKNASLVN